MARASRGPIPKKPGSNSAAPYRKPPCRVYDVPLRSGSGSNRLSRSQPRSAGNSEIPSPPAASNSHSWSGLSTPPGYRQAIPTMAIGSSTPAVAAASARPATSPVSCSYTYPASAAGVG
ncbi:hypothetical protein B0E53_06458 [Micromonospora sp. MH33]|nr:hypothetical protein B0E53_06458 [Micromonospora sp. MH33]